MTHLNSKYNKKCNGISSRPAQRKVDVQVHVNYEAFYHAAPPARDYMIKSN